MNRHAKRLIALFLTAVMVCSMLVAPAYAVEAKATISAKTAVWNGNKCTVEVVSEGGSYEITSGEYEIHFDHKLLQLESITGGTFAGGITMTPAQPVAITNANSSGKIVTGFLDSALGNTTIPDGQVLATYVFAMVDGVEADDAEFTISEILFTRQGTSEGEEYEDGVIVPGEALKTRVPGLAPRLQETFIFSNEITVNGSKDGNRLNIEIPALKAGKAQDKEVILGDLNWSAALKEGTTKGDPDDIDFEVTENGDVLVYIDNYAEEGIFTITGTPKDSTQYSGTTSGELTVKRAPSSAITVKFFKDGTTEPLGSTYTIGIPSEGSASVKFIAKAYDQFDEAFMDADINTEDTLPEGIQYGNGTVTVVAGTTSGSSITLKTDIGSGTLTVKAMDVDVKWDTVRLKNPAEITYGDALDTAFDTLGRGTAIAFDSNGAEITLNGSFSVEQPATLPAVGPTDIIVKFTVDQNDQNGYAGNEFTNSDYKVTVTKRPVQITWDKNPLTYNGTEQVPTAMAGNTINNDTVTITVTGAKKDAGTDYTATATGVSNTNYTLPTTGLITTFSIKQKDVTISPITAKDKIYDGTTAAELDLENVTITGICNSDEGKVTVSATGAFRDKNAGEDKVVLISNITLTGDAAENYTLSSNSASATATITKKTVKVTGGITVTEKEYDKTTAATLNTSSAVIDGKVDGDNLTVASAVGTFADANAGDSKTVTISGITLGGTNAGNYTLAAADNQTTATGKITKKTLTIDDSAITVTKEYDNEVTAGTLSGELKLIGVIDGDTVTLKTGVTPGAYADAAIGKNKTVILSGIALDDASTDNYSIAATYEFKKAEITKTVPVLGTHFTVTIPADSAYNGEAREATVAAEAEGLGNATVTYAKQKADGTYEDATSAKPVNAGTYKVYVSFAEGTNFAEMTGAKAIDAGNLTINKATRTLSFENSTLLLSPKTGLTAALGAKVSEDKDNSAVVEYTLKSNATKVNRSEDSFTAIGNGVVTVSAKIKGSDNYNESEPVTATVNAWANPAEGLTVSTSTGEVGDTSKDEVTYTITGTTSKTITVTGFMAEGNELAYAVASELTVDTSTEGKLIIKAGDVEVEEYTLDVSGVSALPAFGEDVDVEADLELKGEDPAPTVSDSVPEDRHEDIEKALTDETNKSKNKLEGVLAAAKDALIKAAQNVVKKIEDIDEKIAELDKDTAKIEVRVSMDITATGATDTSYTVDITPKYTVYLSGTKTADSTTDVEEPLQDPEPLTRDMINGTVKVSVVLPEYLEAAAKEANKQLYVKHFKGSSYEYVLATHSGGVVSWDVTGFSTFEIAVKSAPASVTFPKENGTSETLVYDYTMINKTLPSDTKTNYEFKGWKVEGMETPTKVLTEDFLDRLGTGKTAICVFEEISGTTPVTPVTPTPGGSGSGSGSGSGGSGSSSDNDTVNISSSSRGHGTVRLSASSPRKGDTVTITVKPDNGYEVDQVRVLTSSGSTVSVRDIGDDQYTFTMPSGTVKVDVTYRRTGAATQGFADVGSAYWAADAIQWVSDNGYMMGNTATTFNPEGRVTRQQLWMILARMSGANPYNFAEAKNWAVANGISDGTNPGNSVTRQQMVAILYRYAQMKGYSTSGGTAISFFPDSGAVASYAVDAMSWSVGNGIVGGTADGRLNPAGTATRAQFATILQRFYNNVAW